MVNHSFLRVVAIKKMREKEATEGDTESRKDFSLELDIFKCCIVRTLACKVSRLCKFKLTESKKGL